jgi:FAD/FMN-containing dehydrogenase
MSERVRLVEALRSLVGAGLRQEDPYPVAVPASVTEAVGCLCAARDYGFVVLPLGSGSSFPPDFALRRKNVLAVCTARLAGMERLSPFAVRLLAGTPVAGVLRAVDTPRRTLGGLVCDTHRGHQAAVADALWRRVRRVELLDSRGEIVALAGPLCSSTGDSALASLLIGSRGRLGLVTAIEISGTVPVAVENEMVPRSDSLPAAAAQSVVARPDAQRIADESGLFQW